jgi:hypothetical protein
LVDRESDIQYVVGYYLPDMHTLGLLHALVLPWESNRPRLMAYVYPDVHVDLSGRTTQRVHPQYSEKYAEMN